MLDDLLHSNPDEAEAVVHRLTVGTRDMLLDARRIADDLRPAALDQLGLVRAIPEAATITTALAARTTWRGSWSPWKPPVM